MYPLLQFSLDPVTNRCISEKLSEQTSSCNYILAQTACTELLVLLVGCFALCICIVTVGGLEEMTIMKNLSTLPGHIKDIVLECQVKSDIMISHIDVTT